MVSSDSSTPSADPPTEPAQGASTKRPPTARTPSSSPTAKQANNSGGWGGGGSGGGGGSSAYPESVQRLISELAKLPGIGPRSAERLAFHVLKSSNEEAARLSRAIDDVKAHVGHCSICFNLADNDPCPLCADPRRDQSRVLVVEQPKDLIALEQTGMYRGVYHVLLGRISPLDGVGPGDLTVADLLDRVRDPAKNSGSTAVQEVILGLNPTLEGDGTALFLAEAVRKAARERGGSGGGITTASSQTIRVSRLARGLPTGSQLEFANKAVLADAIEGRQVVGE